MTSLYIVFNDAEVAGIDDADSAFTYGVSINQTTKQVNAIGTCPSTLLPVDFYSGVSIPEILPGVTEDVETLYVQAGGSDIAIDWASGYVTDKDNNDIDNHYFGVCTTSQNGNFSSHDGSNGGVSYVIVPHDRTLMPYKIYLNAHE